MRKVLAFEVIQKLVNDNNPKCRLAPLTNVIAVDQKGKRCTFTIGVEAEDVKNYMLDHTRHGGLLLIDHQAYVQAEKELQEADSPEDIKTKAQKWDELAAKIAAFYPDYEGIESEEEGDLTDIGEAAATAFGFL